MRERGGGILRNAEGTKERILEAALEEFSSFGIAGARVDRIAKHAGCNKNMIYIYFENKETLFKTVLEKHITKVYEEITFTPEDLPKYAVNVFDWAMTNPKIVRLMTWYSLEQQVEDIAERTSVREKKLKAIKQAQSVGELGTKFTPSFLMTAIMALATGWTPTHPFGSSHGVEVEVSPRATKESIAEVVRMIARANEG